MVMEMGERRRFHRIRFKANSTLVHEKTAYHVQLENLSLNGALLSLADSATFPLGDECSLSFSLGNENSPLRFTAKVIYSNFALLGIEFVSYGADTSILLQDLLRRLTSERKSLRDEVRLVCRESD